MIVPPSFRFPLLNGAHRFVMRRLFQAGGVIFMLHRVHPAESNPWSPNSNMRVSPAFLETVITAYRRQGFDFISLDDLHAHMRQNRLPRRPFVALTLDDGYRDNYEEAFPLFKKLEVPFTLYITSDFPDHRALVWWYAIEDVIARHERLILGDGRALDCSTPAHKKAAFLALRSELIRSRGGNVAATFEALFPGQASDSRKIVADLSLSWEQIVEMSRHPLCTIGGHSRTHAAFNRLSEADLIGEVVEGNAIIQSHTGKPIEHFCYPFGSRKEVGRREFELIQKMQFKTVTRASGGVVALNDLTHSTALPRVMLREKEWRRPYLAASSPAAPRRVYFVKRIVTDYQVPFLLRLHKKLAERNIFLMVLAGTPSSNEGFSDAFPELPFGIRIETRRVGWKMYLSRNALSCLKDASLILLEQANAQLINYPILVARSFGRACPVAIVGHGAHFNLPKPAPFREWWRNFWLRRADWFFAYTDISSRLVTKQGFPEDRVTVFQNAIDTDDLIREAGRLADSALDQLRFDLFGEHDRRPTGIFCARLVKEKDIPFLLECLNLLHDRLPAFRMILIGDGPEHVRVRSFCETRPWCRWVGRKNGLDRVPYFKLADLFICPAPLGLAILDAFALGLPVATTDHRRHGPEIAYLSPGANGLVTPVRPGAFADAVAALLDNPALLADMRAAARKEGLLRTVDRMTDLFADGIIACLHKTEGPLPHA